MFVIYYWPSILESVPQFWISDTAPKTTLFEGVEINFGHQFFPSALAIYMACAFCKQKNDKNRPNMTVAAAQRKNCRI